MNPQPSAFATPVYLKGSFARIRTSPKASIVAIGLALAWLIMLSGSLAIAGTAGTHPVADRGATLANQSSEQVCDANADYFLGMEDYGEAVRAHRRVLTAHPDDSLAHYHLGFAYGMTGDRQQEITEYRKAAALGLRQWDLYLNLGRALLESDDLTGATGALNTAVALAPDHPETHFNLGLAYERRGMLAAALDEMQASLRLDPRQPDALNMMGLIYAEERNYPRAREVWSDLTRAEPDFEPARLNLAILDRAAQPPKDHPPAPRNTLRTAFAFDPD
jgi:tetratricopeptide (TPR) repeat protein